MSASTKRLLLSASISFVFYFAWSYFANQLVSDNHPLVIRSALVQGTLSATITILFTLVLEKSIEKFGDHQLSLIFVVPIICTIHSKTTQNIAIFRTFKHALNTWAGIIKQKNISGALIAPLLPISIQASISIAVNWLNHTPNLWLTVAPSILFTAIYGYMYTFALLKKPKQPAYPE